MDKIPRQSTFKDVKGSFIKDSDRPIQNDPPSSSSSSSSAKVSAQEKRLMRTKSMFGMKKNHEIMSKSNLMMKVGDDDRKGGEGEGVSFNLLDGKSREERRNRARTLGGKAKDGTQQRKGRRLTFYEDKGE